MGRHSSPLAAAPDVPACGLVVNLRVVEMKDSYGNRRSRQVEGKVTAEWNVDIVTSLRTHALSQPCVPPLFRGIYRIRSN